ncbi:MAG: hypothetical protein ACLTYN_00010 [Dysosmobacter welbionis]
MAFILGTAVLLVRQLRKARTPLAAMLLACLVMMNLHGLMEISSPFRCFSVRRFPAAAANSVLRNLYRGEEKAGRRYCGPGGVGPVAGDFCCPAGGSLLAQRNIGSWMLPE